MKLRILLILSFPILCLPAQAWGETFDDLAARAATARDADDIPRAVELYKQALEVNPQWREGWWFLGSLLYDADRYDEARVALTRCVELQPEMAPAWGLLGLSEFETGDYDHALQHIRQSLADSHMEKAMVRVLRYHEAALLARAGEFQKALTTYGWFADDADAPPLLLTAIGIPALRETLLPSDIPAGRQDLFQAAGTAVWYAMKKDDAQAVRAFEQLVGRFPDSPRVHALYAAYLMGPAPGMAVAQLRRELEIEPADPDVTATLACAMLDRGDAAGALPYAEKAVQEAPRLPMAEYAVGRSLMETGDLGKGMEYLEVAVQLDPDNVEGHLALATAYSKAGRVADARAERSRALELAQGVATVARR